VSKQEKKIKQLNITNFMARSLRKGPYVGNQILKKLNIMIQQNNKHVTIKVKDRASTIIPSMIGYTFGVYNGRVYIPVVINDQMIGHKLGEFAPTRTFKGHAKKEKQIRKK